MGRCVGIEPCTLVMDLEGTDGRERGEVRLTDFLDDDLLSHILFCPCLAFNVVPMTVYILHHMYQQLM